MSTKHSIELIARGALFHGSRVLLCQSKKHGYMYLPGGHVEFSESAAAAVQREFHEETGLVVRVRDLLLVSEGAFKAKKRPHHEVNLVFHVEHPPTASNPLKSRSKGATAKTASDPKPIRSKEPEIAFIWVDLAAIPDLDVRPLAAKAYLAQLGDRVIGQVEWVSEIGAES